MANIAPLVTKQSRRTAGGGITPLARLVPIESQMGGGEACSGGVTSRNSTLLKASSRHKVLTTDAWRVSFYVGNPSCP